MSVVSSPSVPFLRAHSTHPNPQPHPPPPSLTLGIPAHATPFAVPCLCAVSAAPFIHGRVPVPPRELHRASVPIAGHTVGAVIGRGGSTVSGIRTRTGEAGFRLLAWPPAHRPAFSRRKLSSPIVCCNCAAIAWLRRISLQSRVFPARGRAVAVDFSRESNRLQHTGGPSEPCTPNSDGEHHRTILGERGAGAFVDCVRLPTCTAGCCMTS